MKRVLLSICMAFALAGGAAADGLVGRKVYPEVPIRVEYELTDMGQSLMPLIRSLTEWALAHQETILAYRRDFDGSK